MRGLLQGRHVWLHRRSRTKAKSPKLQYTWRGSYRIITRIKDLVHRIQRNPTSRMVVIHLHRLAPYQGIVGTSGPKEEAAGAVGEQSPWEPIPGRKKAGWAETGRSAGASKTLICHPPGRIHMSQARPLWKGKMAVDLRRLGTSSFKKGGMWHICSK
jgi:hypothetical protein